MQCCCCSFQVIFEDVESESMSPSVSGHVSKFILTLNNQRSGNGTIVVITSNAGGQAINKKLFESNSGKFCFGTVRIWIPNQFSIKMVEMSSDTKWSCFGMPFEYRTARPFEYQTNGRHCKTLRDLARSKDQHTQTESS